MLDYLLIDQLRHSEEFQIYFQVSDLVFSFLQLELVSS